MTSISIANQIRRLRFEHGEMTQEALAKACGVTRQTVIALEAGRYAPSLELAFKLSRVFDVGVEDVFQYSAPVAPTRISDFFKPGHDV
jgi:putative transcriptional regulator